MIRDKPIPLRSSSSVGAQEVVVYVLEGQTVATEAKEFFETTIAADGLVGQRVRVTALPEFKEAFTYPTMVATVTAQDETHLWLGPCDRYPKVMVRVELLPQ